MAGVSPLCPVSHLSESCWLELTTARDQSHAWPHLLRLTDLTLSAGVSMPQPGVPQDTHTPSAQLRPPQMLYLACSPLPHPPVTLASCSCQTGPHLCPGLCQLSTELAPARPLVPYSDTTHPGRLLPAQATAWPRLPDKTHHNLPTLYHLFISWLSPSHAVLYLRKKYLSM